jgi:hypothetical protein
MDLLNQPPLLAISLLVLFAAMVEAGFRLGALAGVVKDEHRRKQTTASRDALGVLLSLLLGFTVAMALPAIEGTGSQVRWNPTGVALARFPEQLSLPPAPSTGSGRSQYHWHSRVTRG